MRAHLVLVSSLLAGCGGWPGDTVDGEAPEAPPEAPRDVGTDCTSLSARLTATAPQVNGAFCFGVASGASEFLACAQASQSETQCQDQVLGTVYVVQWAGGRGSVFAGGSAPIGVVTQRSPSEFEIESNVGPDGVCTLGAAGVSRAQFCSFVP